MSGIDPPTRIRFDQLLERVLDALPDGVHALLEESPLIVDDRPSPEVLREFKLEDDPDGLCGLHSGVPLTERSVEDGWLPETIHLYRGGIVAHAGGAGAEDAEIEREIRITLLHEIGHHFGLDEDDLAALGYD